MWRWDQGRLLYFQFDILRDIAKTLVKFDNADISKCENLFRQTLVTETGMPFLPDYYTVKQTIPVDRLYAGYSSLITAILCRRDFVQRHIVGRYCGIVSLLSPGSTYVLSKVAESK